jgi:trans-aconitate methyltransferase
MVDRLRRGLPSELAAMYAQKTPPVRESPTQGFSSMGQQKPPGTFRALGERNILTTPASTGGFRTLTGEHTTGALRKGDPSAPLSGQKQTPVQNGGEGGSIGGQQQEQGRGEDASHPDASGAGGNGIVAPNTGNKEEGSRRSLDRAVVKEGEGRAIPRGERPQAQPLELGGDIVDADELGARAAAVRPTAAHIREGERNSLQLGTGGEEDLGGQREEGPPPLDGQARERVREESAEPSTKISGAGVPPPTDDTPPSAASEFPDNPDGTPQGKVNPYDRHRRRNPQEFEKRLAKELRQFDIILNDAFAAGNYIPPQGDVTILNVGCGFSNETPVLLARFGGKNPENVTIIGIDSDERRTSIAQRTSSDLPGHFVFIAGDASRMTDYPMLPSEGEADFVLLRRQNIDISGTVQPWIDIFSQSMDRLKPGGVAVVTSLSKMEHEYMLGAFLSLGYSPDHTGLTRYHVISYATHPTEIFMPIDHSVAMFRKPLGIEESQADMTPRSV